MSRIVYSLFFLFIIFSTIAQIKPKKIFISVDMEGIGGIGTSKMVGSSGKDYNTGRALMTEEVNTVVAAIFEQL